MKRLDLRTGMIVTFSNGHKGRVMLGVGNRGIISNLISYEKGGLDRLDNWDQDLTSNTAYYKDIVKVETCKWLNDLGSFCPKNNKTLWELVTETPAEKEKREIVKQMKKLTERINKLEDI